MNKNTPLLKGLGYQRMIETLTPVDMLLANDLLAPFLHDFKGVNAKRVAAIAYLFGIKQGIHEVNSEFDRKSLEDHMLRVYEMGKQHGLHHMAILLGAEPMFLTEFNYSQGMSSGNDK